MQYYFNHIYGHFGTVYRWCEVDFEFGYAFIVLSKMFYETSELVCNKFQYTVDHFRGAFLTMRAEIYADVIKSADRALDSCIAFIDATSVYIARPKELMQRIENNGHERRNALKMQMITVPDGLIFNMKWPMEARKHDITFYRTSNIEQDLTQGMIINGHQYCFSGDPLYWSRAFMIIPYAGENLSHIERCFKKSIATVRSTME